MVGRLGWESKGLKVNAGKMEVMILAGEELKQTCKAAWAMWRDLSGVISDKEIKDQALHDCYLASTSVWSRMLERRKNRFSRKQR